MHLLHNFVDKQKENSHLNFKLTTVFHPFIIYMYALYEYVCFFKIEEFKINERNLSENILIDIEEDNSDFNKDILEFFDLEDIKSIVYKNSNILIDEKDLLYGYASGLKLDWSFSQNKDWLYGGYHITLFDGFFARRVFWNAFTKSLILFVSGLYEAITRFIPVPALS